MFIAKKCRKEINKHWLEDILFQVGAISSSMKLMHM
jgi:hypothetical protein